jgi:hypothetical protein
LDKIVADYQQRVKGNSQKEYISIRATMSFLQLAKYENDVLQYSLFVLFCFCFLFLCLSIVIVDELFWLLSFIFFYFSRLVFQRRFILDELFGKWIYFQKAIDSIDYYHCPSHKKTTKKTLEEMNPQGNKVLRYSVVSRYRLTVT